MKSNLTFKTFLAETSIQDTTKKISLEDAAAFIQKYASASWKEFAGRIKNPENYDYRVLGPALYRGVSLDDGIEAMAMDTTQHLRRSANTGNLINTMVSNMPSWSKFPKRNMSAICTVDYSYARHYGNAWYVFPFDGTTIGVASFHDFWYSFDGIEGGTFDEVTEILAELLDSYVRGIDLSSHANYQDIVKAGSMLDADYRKYDNEVEFGEHIDDLADGASGVLLDTLNYSGNFIKCMEKLLDPTSNGFKLKTAGNLGKQPLDNGPEMWFSGQAVMVNSNYVDELIGMLHGKV